MYFGGRSQLKNRVVILFVALVALLSVLSCAGPAQEPLSSPGPTNTIEVHPTSLEPSSTMTSAIAPGPTTVALQVTPVANPTTTLDMGSPADTNTPVAAS